MNIKCEWALCEYNTSKKAEKYGICSHNNIVLSAFHNEKEEGLLCSEYREDSKKINMINNEEISLTELIGKIKVGQRAIPAGETIYLNGITRYCKDIDIYRKAENEYIIYINGHKECLSLEIELLNTKWIIIPDLRTGNYKK